MAGESDYLIKVVARDIDSYERFLRDQLLQRPTCRRRTRISP